MILSCKLFPAHYREYKYNLFHLIPLVFQYVHKVILTLMYNKVVFYPIVTRFVPESSFESIEYTYTEFFHGNRNWGCRIVAYYFVLAWCGWTCLVYTLREVCSSLGDLWGVKPLRPFDASGSLCSIVSWRSSRTYRSLRAVETWRPDRALELFHVVYLQERWLQHIMVLLSIISQGSVVLRVYNALHCRIIRYPVGALINKYYRLFINGYWRIVTPI